MAMKRIPPEHLRAATEVLFTEGAVSGSHMAREIDVDPTLLWRSLHERGLPVEDARALAQAMDGLATKLRHAARALRSATREAA